MYGTFYCIILTKLMRTLRCLTSMSIISCWVEFSSEDPTTRHPKDGEGVSVNSMNLHVNNSHHQTNNIMLIMASCCNLNIIITIDYFRRIIHTPTHRLLQPSWKVQLQMITHLQFWHRYYRQTRLMTRLAPTTELWLQPWLQPRSNSFTNRK